MWTIGRLLEWTRGYFTEHRLDQPRLCAEILLAHALRCEKISLYTRFEEVPSGEAIARFRELVRRAARHEPIAHLAGSKEFFSLGFEVTGDVLIPRPETETLVELAIDEGRRRCDRPCRILDLGTGSGCIGVALAKYLPDARVVGTDISTKALAIAERNVRKHGMSDRISLVEADGVRIPSGHVPGEGFDLICCNPPYVAERDRDSLPLTVRDFEPAGALFAGLDGLDFYRALAGGIGGLLAGEGVMFLEIGFGQGEAVLGLFVESGLRHLGTAPDPAGIPRVVRFGKR